MMKKLMIGLLAAVTVMAGMSMSAQAGVSEDRIQLMKQIGSMMRSGAPAADVEAKFNELKAIALWPSDSATGTRAKPSIWNGDALVPEFVAIIDQGAAAAAANDFANAGKTCGACHSEFRGPKP